MLLEKGALGKGCFGKKGRKMRKKWENESPMGNESPLGNMDCINGCMVRSNLVISLVS